MISQPAPVRVIVGMASTRHDVLKGRHCIHHAALRAHRLPQHSCAVSHPSGGDEVESAGECISLGPSAIDGGNKKSLLGRPRPVLLESPP